VLGIGASHADKDWPDAHWAKFLSALRERATGTVFLIGGSANSARAERFIAAGAGGTVINACDLSLMQATALLRHADLFVGPSSGPLNLAAAVGIEAFGLFGSTPVLTYSKFIHALVPDGGPSPGGMARLTPEQTMAAIEPFIAREKVPN
jgi:ADP-heptose:LPS heptosyltransferase